MTRSPLQALALFISVLFARPLAAASAGTGLWGQYYQDTGFKQFVAGQLDPQVNFLWPNNVAPLAGMNDSTFAVRWSGQIEALCADNYTFSTVSDDGVRLWINGTLVIDNWTNHSSLTDTAAPVFINAGATVSVVMELYENYGNAEARLLWQAPGCVPGSVAIPSAQLYPNTQPNPTPSPTATVLPVWSCPVSDSLSSLSGAWTATDINPMAPGNDVPGSPLAINADGSGVLLAPMFSEAATGDSFRFLYQKVSGDFDVVLKVVSAAANPGAQAGLMLRESVDEGSRQVFVGGSQTGSFQESHRLSTGAGNAGSSALGFTQGGNQWVRLRRSGTTVQAFYGFSATGPWTQLGATQTLSGLGPDLLLGIAASSDEPGVLGQARVSGFAVLSAGCTTATPTITATATASPTFSASPTASNTPTITQSFTDSPTFTHTPTVTPTPSITETFTHSPTNTHTPTATPSPTITVTFSVSPTWTSSPTFSPSPTISPTFTPGPGPPLSHLVAYPNPFADRLWLGFTLGAAASVEFVAFNVAGEEVYRDTQSYPQGTQLWPWDGVNTAGQRLASGIYVLRLKANGDVGWESAWVTVALVR